jgi:competence protein ComEC
MPQSTQGNWFIRHPFLVVLFILLLIDLSIFAFVFARKDVLTVAFLNVGQGDAIFIEAPNGDQLLYDAGPPSGAVLRELNRVMPYFDRSIDIAIFSHPDMDHIGGFLDVFDRYHIDALLEPGVGSTNGAYDEARRVIAAHGIERLIARRGMMIEMGGGVIVEILYPDRDTTGMETNDASIVLRVRYGETAFLLSGDLPKREEEHIVSLGNNALRAQVLKLGHHGSHTSSSETWLRTVAPETAIISAGKDNRYGHPHKDTLELLERLNIPTLTTFQEGTIVFESDGTKIDRK